MAKGGRPPRAHSKRKIEHYTHVGKDRTNNPPVGLVTPETDLDVGNKSYAYDPHIDPALQSAGKAERTSFDIPTVSLHVHERIDPRSIIEAVRKKNGEDFVQGSLFSRRDENPPIREAIEFYKHRHNWSNRLIAGDSLLVMNSLLEKEGMAGKVQMVYIDPPYGIEYKSNFQPFLTSRVELARLAKGEDKGKYRVTVNGFDYYNTKTGDIESGGTDKIAMWMLDTDYDGRSLFPRQVFFIADVMKDGLKTLADESACRDRRET